MTKQLAVSACNVRFAGFQQLLFAALFAVACAGLLPQRSLAQGCSGSPSYSPDFSSNQGCLRLNSGPNGGASFETGANSTTLLQLTRTATNQVGSAWYTTPQPVANSFSTTFTFQLTGGSADGFAFVVQNSPSGTSYVGYDMAGCALGYAGDPLGVCGSTSSGVTNSVAVGFKTYNNGTNYPSANSVFIASNGTGENCENVAPASDVCVKAQNDLTSPSITLADGNVHTATVTYTTQPSALQTNCSDSAGCLDVILDGTDLFPHGVSFTMTSIGLTNNSAYVGFTGATGASVENNNILSWVFSPQSFGEINVCPPGQTTPAPCSVTMPLTFTMATSTTIGSVQVVTQGITGLDFQPGSGGTCTGTIPAGSFCTVKVTFAPIAPGLRLGAVELFDNSTVPNLVATRQIYGIGQGPAAAFSPLTSYVENTGAYPLRGPKGVAVDAAGDLFIADTGNGRVVEIGSHGIQTVGTGLESPQGLALDGAGDLFIADSGLNEVVEVAANGGAQTVVYSPAPLPFPVGVAVDGAGDLFIADTPIGVVEIPAGCTANSCRIPVGSGWSQPQSVAVDAAGNLFVADPGIPAVVEVPAGCTSSACQTRVGSGWSQPESVAVDAAGDVIVADAGLGAVVEVPAGCTSSSCQVTLASRSQLSLGSGFQPFDATVDAQGDVYIADYGNNRLDAILQGFQSLNFSASTVGNVSVDSPESVLFQNIGNQTLNTVSPGLVLTDTSDFTQVPGPGTPAECTTTFSLVPGAACDLSVNFDPQSSGAIQGVAQFFDNALNNTLSSQSVGLNGTGLAINYTLTVSTAGNGSGTLSGTNCATGSYVSGTTVTCMETPAVGSQFTGWSGGTCSGLGACSFPLGTNSTVVANFSLTYPLTVTEVGTGTGTVTDNQSQISCSAANGAMTGTCSGSYPSGTLVTLTANATGTSIFAGWGGDCASAAGSATCNVTINSALNISASFVAPGPAQSGMLKPITAGVVYGQGGSFTTNNQNNGGVGAGSLYFHAGLAVDGGGNLYVADAGNNRVLFYPAGSSTATRVYGQNGSFTTNTANNGGVSANSLWNPQGLALDSSGNLYVADQYNNRVLFYPSGSTTATRVYGQGGSFNSNTQNNGGVSANSLGQPWALALDSSGNLYVTDYLNSRVLFYPSGSTTATRVYGQGGSFTSSTANNGGVSPNSLDQPTGVALDSSGDLYVADIYNNRVLFYPYNSTTAARVYGQLGSFTAATSNNGGVSANSLNNPMAVALDSSGDLYVADRSNNRVLFYLFGSTTAARVYGQLGSFNAATSNNGGVSANSLSQPWAVALDNSGNLYVTDYSNGRVLGYSSFGNVNVCPSGQSTPAPCNRTISYSYYAAATTNFGVTQVVTQGVTGLDFTLGSGGTCTGTVSAGNICTLNVSFTPLAPGMRMGAANLFDNLGNLLATAPIYGVGQAPEAAFGPGTQTTVASGMAGPREVALDGAGDIFIAQNLSNQVVEIPAGGGAPRTVGSGLNGPWGVAVDGAGDVFIADTGNNRVVELPAGGGPQMTVASGLNNPLGVTTDGAGDLFIADTNNNQVLELPAGGGPQKTVASGLNNPNTVVVDSTGDVFIVDSNSQLVEIPAGCASSACQTSVGTGLSNPRGAAVDAAGDVFIADTYASLVIEIPAGCVSAACEITVGSGFGYPWGVAVDGAGDVFITDTNDDELIEVNRSLPPSLNFALTAVSNTSADSPHLISVQNVGNQPLLGSVALTLGPNFAENAGSTCGSGFPLSPGASCSESFSFTPQSTGLLTGTAAFSDNTLNLAPSVVLQAVNLSGISSANGQTLGVVPNVVGMTQSAAMTALTNAGLTLGPVTTQYSDSQPAGSVIGENPAAGAQVNLGSTVALLTSVGEAPTPAPNPLSLLNNYFVTGDYAAAGVTLRGTGTGGMATGTINIPDSTTTPGVSQGVPDGADIIDGFLYWETLENTPSPSGNSGTFLGFPITGQQIGSDLPFTDGTQTGTLRVYRANVNTYFPVYANGSGLRYGSGTFTVSLPDSGGHGFPVTEGASLVVIYRVLSPNFPLKSVVIYDGSAIPTASTSQNVQGFYDALGGGGESTTLFYAGGNWNNSFSSASLTAHASQYSAPLNAGNAYGAVILSTPVTNSDNDGILDVWKSGPAAGDFFAGQPGYYDVKTQAWVPLPGAQHGEKDLFVQLDYMCGAVLANGSCDPNQENFFPSPDAQGNNPLTIVQNSFAAMGIVLHLKIGNAVPESTCTDTTSTNPPQLCEFPNQPGVIDWKNSLEISKVWPRNAASCAAGGDCTARFPYGQKDSYHYLLFGHSLAIPAWNTPYQTLTSITVASGLTTIVTADRGAEGSINYCPSRFTISGVQGNPSLNGIYNTSSCPDSKTIILSTPGVPNWTYPNNTLPEPEIGLTSGSVTSISGYSDLGGQDSAVTLGLWETAPNQNMATRANVIAGTTFHEIGHTLGLTHGGRYYDTPGSYIPTYEANCKPNFQSTMNYLFQLDGVGPNATVAFSNQTLATLLPGSLSSVTQLTDGMNNPATFSTSSWYTSVQPSSGESAATMHCDGTPLTGDTGYRINGPIAPITPPWSNGQNITFDGVPYTQLRGYNDAANVDLRQVGATGGQFASLASVLSFASSATPLSIAPGGNVTLGTGGTVTLGSGGTVTLGSGGNATLGSAGTIALGSGGSVTLNNGGTATLPSSGGTITLGSGGTVALGSGGTVTLGSGGTIALGSGGTVTLGSGGTVTLASGGTIALGSGGSVTIPSSGGSYTLPSGGGTITLGSGGTVALGSGGTVTLGSGGTIALGSGGTVALGSGGTVTLGSGGTIALGSGGTIALGSGGNVTLGSGGTIALGSGGTVALGSGGTVTLGSGGTVTLGSGGNVSVGSGGTVTLGSGGTVALGSGGTVALGSGGTVTLGSGGTIALGSGGTVTLGSGGTVTLGSGGTVTLGSGGNLTLSSGGTITLGSGGTIALGSGGTIALGSGGVIALGSGGTIALGSGGTVALGSGGTIALGSGGTVALGSGGAMTTELDFDGANSIVRPPVTPSETPMTMPAGQQVVVNWTAPAFGVVATYSVYRSTMDPPSTVLGPPVLIGSVSGVNGNPPATTFTDTNPDLTATTVVYTIVTTLVPDSNGNQRQSPPSPPAVLKNNQTIVLGSLPSSVVISSSPLTVTATAETNNAANMLQVSFSASGNCSIASQSIDPATGISSASVTLTSTGSCTITASQSGASSYNAADPVSGSFTILPQGSNIQSQTIAFPQLQNVQYGGTFSLSATASSGQAVTFSASGPCTISGTTTGVGLCTITASAPANSTYSAAMVTQSFSVLPAVIKVTAASPTITYGQQIPTLTYSLSGFVNNDPTSVVNGTPALSTTATSTSNVGSYPITVATGTLAATNYSFLYVPGTLTINTAGSTTAAANATAPYSPGSQSVSLSATVTSTAGTVNAGTVTFTLLNGGTPVGTATTSGTVSNGAASVSYTLPAGAQAGTYTIQAVYNGSTDFAGSSDNSHTLMVNAVTATVQLNNLTQTYTGSPISATAATTPSGLTVNITYNGSTTMPTKAGSYSVVATVQNADYTGSATGTLQINQATPTLTWATPAPITYGTALSASQLDAAATFNSAPLAGTFNYTPAASAVLPAGTQTLSVTFNPGDSTDFKAVTKTAPLVVNRAVLTVTANNVSQSYGTAIPTLSVNYTGFVNKDTLATAVTGSPIVTTTAVATSPPGSYPIMVSQGTLAAANYTFTFVTGTLTITFTGSVPPSGTACNGAYTGTFQGNLTVAKGQNCVFVGGGASGNVTETGGNVTLSGATVGGNVTVSGGTFSIGPSTNIKGNLQIQSIPSASVTNQVCATTVGGNLQFQSNGTSVLIGSGSSSCAGNVIKGSLQVLSNTAPITLDGNTVSGALQVQSNSAAVTIDTNTVSGALQVQSNSGATMLDGNTVGQSLQDQSNTGPTQVISNVITGTLQCQSNTSITGSGNTATSKQGQCAKF